MTKHIDGIYQSPVEQRLAREEAEWARLLQVYGVYGLTKKIVKLESFRKYIRRYPYDLTQAQYDDIYNEDGVVYIEAKQPSVEDEVDVRMRVSMAVDSLSVKQKKVWDLMQKGYTHKQIKDKMGFKTENAVRWHKHMIKKALEGQDE